MRIHGDWVRLLHLGHEQRRRLHQPASCSCWVLGSGSILFTPLDFVSCLVNLWSLGHFIPELLEVIKRRSSPCGLNWDSRISEETQYNCPKSLSGAVRTGLGHLETWIAGHLLIRACLLALFFLRNGYCSISQIIIKTLKMLYDSNNKANNVNTFYLHDARQQIQVILLNHSYSSNMFTTLFTSMCQVVH